MKTRTELLTAKNRFELADLCMRMGLEPAGSGEKKAETAARLLEAMDSRPNAVRTARGLYCLAAVREAVGSRRGEITLPLGWLDKDPTLEDALDQLRHFGLAYRDRRCWHLLPEVRSLIRLSAEDRKELEVSMELLQHMTLAINRFGVAPIHVALGLKKDADTEDEMIRMGMLTLYSQFHGLAGFCPGPDGKLWLRALVCEDPAATLTAQMACETRGIAWPEDGLRDVCGFADADVPLSNEAMEILRELLPQLSDASPDLIAECIEDAFLLFQDGDREGALDALCDIFTDEENTPARRWLMDRLLNRLPVWALRGHTISEVSGGTWGKGRSRLS